MTSPVQALDRVIHEKARLAIMSALAGAVELAFIELREALEMTDGNLMTHMRTLEDAGFVELIRSRQGNRSQTLVRLTDEGRKAFGDYINCLESIVRKSKRSLAG